MRRKKNSYQSKQTAWIRRKRRTEPPEFTQEELRRWYVPFDTDGRAKIYHGHEDPNDHSECGPQIFCCPNAARVYLARFPDSYFHACDWQYTDFEDLLEWFENGVPLMYFYYCDLNDKDSIHFVGVGKESLPDVLRRKISLHDFNDIAYTIRSFEE